MSLLPKKIVGLDFSFTKFWLGFFLEEFFGGLLGSSYSMNYWGDWVFFVGGILDGVGFFSEDFLVIRGFFFGKNFWQVGFFFVEFLVGCVFLRRIFGGFCGIWSIVVVARNEICNKAFSQFATWKRRRRRKSFCILEQNQVLWLLHIQTYLSSCILLQLFFAHGSLCYEPNIMKVHAKTREL